MKAWKIFLIIGVIALLIGAAVFITGLALNDWKFTTNYEMKTFNSAENDSRLELELGAGNMNVEFYDGETVAIDYPDSSTRGYTVTEAGGTIALKPRKFIGFIFGWNQIPDVTVKIPRGKIMDLRVDVSAGQATVEGGTFGAVDIGVSAGKFKAGAIACTTFDADVSAGSINVDGAKCNTLRVDCSAGSATIGGIVCNDINVDTSAGEVKLTVVGAQSDYTVLVDKSAGDCNISSQQGAVAGKKIDVDVSAGKVYVNFVSAA